MKGHGPHAVHAPELIRAAEARVAQAGSYWAPPPAAACHAGSAKISGSGFIIIGVLLAVLWIAYFLSMAIIRWVGMGRIHSVLISHAAQSVLYGLGCAEGLYG